jgi:hypothetical protein
MSHRRGNIRWGVGEYMVPIVPDVLSPELRVIAREGSGGHEAADPNLLVKER